MRFKEYFVLALRVIGVLQIIRAIQYLVEAFDISARLYQPGPAVGIGATYTHILVYLLVGLYLLSGAPHVVRLLFGTASDTAVQEPNISSSPAMDPRAWFVLILRAFGVWQLIVTLERIAGAFNVIVHLSSPQSGTQVGAFATHAFVSFALSLWLLKFAPSIAQFFYPPSTRSEATPDR